MALQIHRTDPAPERQVLVAILWNRAVLAAVAERWHEPGLFASKYANLLAKWSIEHYKKYKEPPRQKIDHHFRVWAETGDRETIEMIEALLVSLNDELRKLKLSDHTPDYVLDVANRLFERVQIKRLIERAESYLEVGDLDRARELIDKSRKIELGTGSGINVLADDEAMRAALEHKTEPIVEYPGAMGNFFNYAMYRGAFIAFMGKEKSGKSFWLQDLAWRAVEQQRNVAYFEVGDSIQPEVLQRFAVRIAGRPIKPETYDVPVSMVPGEGREMPKIKFDRRHTKTHMTVEEEQRARWEWRDKVGPDRFKLSCRSSNSISVSGIEAILETWERDGWFPDVVVIDYSDILKRTENRVNKRDEINDTWIGLRGITQRHRCLVATATQSDADSYDTWLMSMDNFSEDKRKYGHVTGTVGINQTHAEKEKGVYRLNWVTGRALRFSEKKVIWCAGCLSIGQPFIHSSF